MWSPTPRSVRNRHPETAGLCAAYGSRRREPGVFSKGAGQTRGAGRRTGWRPHRVLKTAIGRFYNQQLDTCRVTIWTINCTQWALGVSDIESALRQHRAGPALAADYLKACQQLELRRIRSHNAQFALITQHDQAVPSRHDRPLTESLLTPLTSPLQPRNKVLCAVWTAESFASVWNSPMIFSVARNRLSEHKSPVLFLWQVQESVQWSHELCPSSVGND